MTDTTRHTFDHSAPPCYFCGPGTSMVRTGCDRYAMIPQSGTPWENGPPYYVVHLVRYQCEDCEESTGITQSPDACPCSETGAYYPRVTVHTD